MADAAFREELAALVEDIKELAYERHLAQAEGTGNEPFVDTDALRDYIEMRVTEHGPGRFGYYAQGDLDSFETMVHLLNDPQGGARKELTGGLLEDIDLVLQNIAGWGGPGANAFRNSFVTQLGSAVNNQLVYIEELSRILACYHEILATARDGIKAIANNAKAALRNLPQGVSGGTIFEVFDSMDAGIHDLDVHLWEREQDVDQGLTGGIGHFDNPGDVDRPGDDPNDFEPAGGLALTNIAKLYAAGEVVSSLAYRYHKALSYVDSASGLENSAFEGGVMFGYTYGKWTTARDLLRCILWQTKDNLIDTAGALHRIAEAYAETEGINGQTLQAAVDVELTEFDRTTMEQWEETVALPPSAGPR